MTSIDELQHWNPLEGLPDHFLIIMYGLRRSGKSVLMRQLLYDIWPKIENHKVYLFSNTASVNKDQYDYFPEDFMIKDCRDLEPHLRQILEDQKEIIKSQEAAIGDGSKSGGHNKPQLKGKKVVKEKTDPDKKRKAPQSAVEMREKQRLASKKQSGGDGGSGKGDARTEENHGEVGLHNYKDVLLIFDDVCSENAVRTSPSLGFLATCGRHVRTSIIILSQVVAGSASVPPVVRTQADFIIVVAQPRSMKERELISKQYLTAENRTNAAQRGLHTMEMVTETKYRSLVIDTNSTEARNLSDYVYYYGPVPFPFPHDEWRVGLNDQWREEKENEDYEHDFFKTHKKQKSENLPQTDKPATLTSAPNYETQFKTALFKHGKVPFRLKTPYQGPGGANTKG